MLSTPVVDGGNSAGDRVMTTRGVAATPKPAPRAERTREGEATRGDGPTARMVIPSVDHNPRRLPSGERLLTGPERGCEGSGLDWLLPNQCHHSPDRALSEPNDSRGV